MGSREPDLTRRGQISVDSVNARRIDDGPFGGSDENLGQYFFKLVQPVFYPESVVCGMRVNLFAVGLEEQDFPDGQIEFLLPFIKYEI